MDVSSIHHGYQSPEHSMLSAELEQTQGELQTHQGRSPSLHRHHKGKTFQAKQRALEEQYEQSRSNLTDIEEGMEARARQIERTGAQIDRGDPLALAAQAELARRGQLVGSGDAY